MTASVGGTPETQHGRTRCQLERQPRPERCGLPAPVTAEFGRGVTFRTDNDAFELTMRARVQPRFTLLTAAPPSTDAPITEFSIRRARLLFQGHFFSRDWQYYIQLGFSNRDTEADLRLPLREGWCVERCGACACERRREEYSRYARHGVGFHFDPSASRLKCMLVV